MTRPSGRVRFKAQFRISVFEEATEFGLDVFSAEFATFGEAAEVLLKGRTLGEDCFRQFKQFLQITVPCRQPKVFVEHDDTITHIIKGHLQLGLALPDFIEETGILQYDDGLRHRNS